MSLYIALLFSPHSNGISGLTNRSCQKQFQWSLYCTLYKGCFVMKFLPWHTDLHFFSFSLRSCQTSLLVTLTSYKRLAPTSNNSITTLRALVSSLSSGDLKRFLSTITCFTARLTGGNGAEQFNSLLDLFP